MLGGLGGPGTYVGTVDYHLVRVVIREVSGYQDIRASGHQGIRELVRFQG